MAEGGIIERSLGGGEGEESEPEPVGTAADPMAAAVAMDAARFDPGLSQRAGIYLEKRGRGKGPESRLTSATKCMLHPQASRPSIIRLFDVVQRRQQ